MNGMDFFQMLPNISNKDSNLKTLKDKSKYKFGNFKKTNQNSLPNISRKDSNLETLKDKSKFPKLKDADCTLIVYQL